MAMDSFSSRLARPPTQGALARNLSRCAILAAAYYVTGRIGLSFPYVGTHVTLLWPPAGLSVAALLCWGLGCWPGVCVGALLVNATHAGTPLWVAAGIAVGNTLGPLGAAVLLQRVGDFRATMERMRDVLWLIVAVFGAMTISATGGAVFLCVGGIQPWSHFGNNWMGWWIGDALSALIVAPAVLTWSAFPRADLQRWPRRTEGIAILVSLLVIGQIVFGFWTALPIQHAPLSFLTLVPLIWAALRFGMWGASWSTLLLSTMAVVGTAGGFGPFVQADLTSGLGLVWAFVGSAAVFTFLVAALHAERDRRAEQLQASEERLRALVEHAFAGITVTDAQGTVLYSGPGNRHVLGYAAEDVRGHSGFEEIHPDDLPGAKANWARMLKNPQEEVTHQFRVRHKDGSWRWLEATARNLLDNPSVRGIVTNWRDVSARKQAAESLRQQETLLTAILEASRDGIAVEDEVGRFLYVNRAFAELYGYDAPAAIIARHASLVQSPEDNERMLAYGRRRLLGEPVPATYEFQGLHRDGRRLDLEASVAASMLAGKPVVVSVIRDIADRKRAAEDRRQLEQRLQEAQKLESIAVLAGGIAHDFNNLLTPILGYSSLAQTTLPPDAPVQPMLVDIEKAAHRAADLIRQMLAYAGKGRFVIEPFDLTAVVQEMVRLLQASIARKAELHLELSAGLPPVEGDTTQVRQVVMNLISNASEALGDAPGAITVRTGLCHADRQVLQAAYGAEDLPEGVYVLLEVADTGCGITPENLTRIFEPFFSTKFTGRGLGLAAVLGIARSHRGAVTVNSTPGRGTTFRVLWPCASATAPQPPTLKPAAWRGNGTVLVIEDDIGVCTLVRHTLEAGGMRVLEAHDGEAGVQAFRAAAADIDLVLLDLTMPRRGGLEILPDLRALRAEVRVLLMSGYTEHDITERFGNHHLVGFVQKPFHPAALMQTIRAALEATGTDPPRVVTLDVKADERLGALS